MFPIPPNETLVETKVCKHCGISFPITDKDMEFYEKVSPTFGGKKYAIPPPTLCPDCRQQRRLSFRNERKLYKRTCDFSGKDIISIYSPDKPFKVYHQDYWWSDKWNPMDYGREFDFSRSAMEQFGELLREVPKASLSNEQQENSEYSNYAGWNKNCYLIFLWAHNDNLYYSNGVWSSNNTIDCSYSTELQDSYHLINSIHCHSCYFSEILENCSNCIFCFNIKGKAYYILNAKVSPEEYIIYKKKLQNSEFLQSEMQKFLALKLSIIHSENFNFHSEDVQGEYILWSQKVYQSFDIVESQHCKYVTWIFRSSNCYDVYDWWDTAEWCYDCHKIGNKVSYSRFCASCLHGVRELWYCYDCVNNSSHLFWCVGLRNASYCILNRQYTKEEYEELVPKIIEHMMTTGEWGEFFPSSLSPFGYNETVAQEYFPLTASSLTLLPQGEGNETGSETLREAMVPPPSPLGEGMRVRWSLYESPFPKVDKIIPASKLPEDISSIPDDILNWAIECEVTGKPFRIIPQELEFYRKHHLPIPRRHPDQRHLDRMKMRNPRKLYERVCDCPECEINNKTSLSSFSPNENSFGTRERDSPTENDKETVDTFVLNPRTGKKGKKMITTYAPERPERVYCEVCYEKEVIGSF